MLRVLPTARILRGLAWSCLLLLAHAVAPAAERAPGQAAIASAHPLATAAGEEILKQGGNAFDAAVAVAAALAVVEPNGSGLTGGGFFLLHRARDGRDVMIDAREKAPGAATRDMFLDAQGRPVPGLSTESALGAGIPGEAAGLVLLARQYGKLPLARSLAPAIRLARSGFPLYTRLQGGIRARQAVFARQSDAARVFLADGQVPPIGYVIRQPELAQTLELLAAQGQDGFYRGAFAHRLVEGVRGLGGNWSEQDLAAYQALERKPIVGTYHDARIVSASPPSSGGVALIEALHILEPYDLRALDAVTRKHLVIEAMRRAFRDRAQYLGDPDFVTVPVERLVSPFYADGQRTSIRLDRALPSSALAPVAGEVNSGPHTTHFSVLDAQGNRAAVTITLNLWFGSGLMVPGTGLLLNDEMDDFSVKAGIPNAYQLVGAEANSIAPGKRPLSSSTPTFVESPRGVMITGSPGGSYIISMAILATLDFLDGKTPQQIVSTPRYHHQYLPDVVLYEPDALDGAERAGLEQLGHTLRESNRRWGNMQVVTWDYASDKVQSASDPRGEGEGLVY